MLVYLLMSTNISQKTVTGDVLGAGGFPIIVAVLGLILLAIITFNVIKKKTRIKIPMFHFKSQEGRAVTTNALVLAAYVALLSIIGYLISTPLFVFASAKLMGYKKNLSLLIFTLVLSAVLIVVFGKIFFIPLPRGIGIFRELSYYIY